MKTNKTNFKEIISFIKDKGFVFQSSEIYGGLANSWDYGPLGTMIKSNIREEWKKHFVELSKDIYHLDSSIMLNSKVWEASGHVSKFIDPIIRCLNNNKNYRADSLIEEELNFKPESLSFEDMEKIIKEKIKLPEFKEKTQWGNIETFNLMFKTNSSKTSEKNEEIFLRPETAQGIFINFKNVLNTYNPKFPFGIAQIGKAFRNEVTPKNFIFRTKEFEQLELEFFTKESEENKYLEHYKKLTESFLSKMNIGMKNIRIVDIPKEELAHYSKQTLDFEYNFPFGWGELLGIANRGNFDLKNHSEFSKRDLSYLDNNTKEKFIPSIIETSIGLERLLLAIICENYEKNEETNREILKLPFEIAPFKASVLPLNKSLEVEADKLYNDLKTQEIGPILFNSKGSIGKRYSKSDSIGTPFCITYDFETSKDNKVTIRIRDTKEQFRVKIEDIKDFIIKNKSTYGK